MVRYRMNVGFVCGCYTYSIITFTRQWGNRLPKWRLLALVLIVSCCREVELDEILEYNMMDYCGKEISLMLTGSHVGRLVLNHFQPQVAPVSVSCSVAIVPGIHKERIGFHFEEVHLTKGMCLDISQRYFRHGDEEDIVGVLPRYCGHIIWPVGREHRTKSSQDLVISLSGTARKDAHFKLKFTLFSENDIKRECKNYHCEGSVCVSNISSCRFGYTPCDFHRCDGSDYDTNDQDHHKGLTNIQIYGIVFGFILGLALCLCRVTVKTSDVKEEIVNRVASYYRNGQHSRNDELDMNRMDTAANEEPIRGRRSSEQDSINIELRRTSSHNSLEQNHTELRSNTPSRRRTNYSPPAFTTVVQCDYSDPEQIRLTLTCDSPRTLAELGATTSPTIPQFISYENYCSHHPCSNSEHIELETYHDMFPVNNEAGESNSLIHDGSQTNSTDHSALPSSTLDEHDIGDPVTQTRPCAIFTDNEHGRVQNVHANLEQASVPLRTDSYRDTSPNCPPPSYAEVIRNEEKFSIKP